MKKTLLILALILSLSDLYAQVNAFGEKEKTEKEWFFAIRLMANLNGSLIQTAIVKPKPDGGYEIQHIPQDDWIRQVMVTENSNANPDKENLIQKYNVFEVPNKITNEGIKEFTLNKTKAILSNLWRLKYSEYPFFDPERNQDKGWAKNPDDKITWMPSESQIQLLKPYGITNLSDFFIGEHLFDLLKDVRNRDWQNRYIQSAGVYYKDTDN